MKKNCWLYLFRIKYLKKIGEKKLIKYIDYQKDQTDIKYFHGIPYIKRPDKNHQVIGQTTLKKTKDKEKDIIVCDDIF